MLVLLIGGYLPPGYLQVYLGTFITLAFPIIPLLALPIGATSIVEEKESGTLQYILSNPITKSEFLIGREIGLLMATSAVVFLGFGLASILVYSIDVRAYYVVVQATLVAALLNLLILGLALVISVLSKRKSTALGIAIFAWFVFTVGSDVGFLSIIINFRLGALAVIPILLNPVECSRLLAVTILNQTTQLGATGAVMNYYLSKYAFAALVAAEAIWLVVCYAAAFLLFKRQDMT